MTEQFLVNYRRIHSITLMERLVLVKTCKMRDIPIIFIIQLQSLKELKGKIRKNWFVLYDKNLFFIFIHIIIEFLTLVLTFSIDNFL